MGAYHNITPREAKKRLDLESGILLIDVSPAEKYKEKHIPGSISMPLDILEREAADHLPNLKAATLILYCRAGIKSRKACSLLAEKGYTDIWWLGSLKDWPYETESS